MEEESVREVTASLDSSIAHLKSILTLMVEAIEYLDERITVLEERIGRRQ
jgi:prefoldin subunit 5